MKKLFMAILTVALVLSSLLALTACGEKVGFDYAVILMPDGSTETIELQAWGTDGQSPSMSYYVYATDGTGYKVGARNCMFINDPDVDINVTGFSALTKLKHDFQEITIKKLDGEILTVSGEDYSESVVQYPNCTDEDGTIFYVHPDNCWIKFTYNQ